MLFNKYINISSLNYISDKSKCISIDHLLFNESKYNNNVGMDELLTIDQIINVNSTISMISAKSKYYYNFRAPRLRDILSRKTMRTISVKK